MVGRPQIFISRAGADLAISADIGAVLEAAGYKVILQQWDFQNRSFIEAMHDALSRDARVVCLLSNAYLESPYCTAEWQATLASDPLNTRRRLILLRIEPCRPAGLLAPLAYWDLVDIRADRSLLRSIVLSAVKGEAQRSAQGAPGAYREPTAILHHEVAPIAGFVGRSQELAALAAHFSTGSTGPAVLTGIDGIGKAALARQYAWQDRSRRSGIWIIDARARAAVEDGLIAAANAATGLTHSESERSNAARQAVALLAATAGARKRWLLIFENLRDPAELGRIGIKEGVDVIITSSWGEWDASLLRMPVEPLIREASIELLLGQTGRSDHRGANALAEAVGDFPLALQHAAIFARRTGMAFGDLAGKVSGLLTTSPRGHSENASVSATIELAVAQADQATALASKVLERISWLAPRQIPLEAMIGDVGMETERLDAVAALRENSLISWEPPDSDGRASKVRVHELVQRIMRARGQVEGVERTGRRMLEVAPGPKQLGEASAQARLSELAPHAAALLDHLQSRLPDEVDTARSIATLFGAYFLGRGVYPSAHGLLTRALELEGRSRTLNPVNTVVALNNLAHAARGIGDAQSAEAHYRRALSLQETLSGPDHPRVASIVFNFGELLRAERRYAEARELLRRALEIETGQRAPSAARVSQALSALALLDKNTGELANAETLARRALAELDRVAPQQGGELALRKNNLGAILRQRGALREAQALCEEAVRLGAVSFGEQHPVYATLVNDLGLVELALKRYRDAEARFRKALAIDQSIFAPNDKRIAINLINLSRALARMGRRVEARVLLAQAEQITRAHKGSPSERSELASSLELVRREAASSMGLLWRARVALTRIGMLGRKS